MPEVRYLTVQDMIWINHRVTGKVLPFDYARLEEATYYQYGYGSSLDIPGQAAKFFEGFQAKAPFAEGNRATAFLGLVAFLRANGHELAMSDSEFSAASMEDALRHVMPGGSNGHGAPAIQVLIEDAMNEFAGSLGATSA